MRSLERQRGYQTNFSELCARAMYDVEGRERKAKTMAAVLQDFLRCDTRQLSLLDIGSSTGVIADYLARHFRTVIGIDIDSPAVLAAQTRYSRPNVGFVLGDGMRLPFPDETFDVVICAQIYEHVPNARLLVAEIHRVLKPGGACYFAAGNRLMFMEPHYRLPLLSVLPRPLAHLYIRLSGRGQFYYERHLTYWGLRRLVQDFEVVDYTRRIVGEPARFHAEYMIRPNTLQGRAARLLLDTAYWLSPGYIWVLRRRPRPR